MCVVKERVQVVSIAWSSTAEKPNRMPHSALPSSKYRVLHVGGDLVVYNGDYRSYMEQNEATKEKVEARHVVAHSLFCGVAR